MQKHEMFEAITKGEFDVVEEALTSGVEDADGDIHMSESGHYSLTEASSLGHLELVKLLLENGADINNSHAVWGSPLLRAVTGNHATVVEYLLSQGADPATVSPHFGKFLAGKVGHPFFDACAQSPQMIDIFLRAGSDVNTKGPNGLTPLMFAARTGNMECLQHLVENGADTSATTEEGVNATFVAAVNDRFDLVKYLVSVGGDINSHPVDSNTILMEAVRKRDIHLVREIIDLGADASIVNKEGQTALSFIDFFEPTSVDLVGLLMKAGADPNASLGKRPLMTEAINNNDAKLVEILINAGANLEVKTQHGDTPLLIAVVGASEKIVAMLLDAGADLHATDSSNRTPMDLVAKRTRNKDVVRDMLEKALAARV